MVSRETDDRPYDAQGRCEAGDVSVSRPGDEGALTSIYLAIARQTKPDFSELDPTDA
jgi:hypothetical protein